MGEDIALGLLVLGETAHFFSAFNPSLFTIKRFPDQQTVHDIAMGCTYATIFGLVLSIATSYIAKSKIPALFGILGIACMNAIYFFTMNSVKNAQPNPINKQS